MLNLKRVALSVSAVAATLSVAASAHALTKILTPVEPGTITGTLPYASDETITFKFTIPAPYTFVFTASGSGGNFPFTISTTATGQSGAYTETFGAYPVHGTVDYSLTTAVPEPAAWSLMLLGVGGLGYAMRRKARAAILA